MEVVRCMIMGKNGVLSSKLGVVKGDMLIRKKYRYKSNGVFYTRLYGLFLIPTLLYPQGHFDPVDWSDRPIRVDGKEYTAEEFSHLIEGVSMSLFELLRSKSSVKEDLVLYLVIGLVLMFVFVLVMGGV